MERSPPESPEDSLWDVVICGGGLAGLLLARQLAREQPALRVMVVERTGRPLPEASHKVGESSVELGSQYLERLGLTGYLLSEHIVKFGLRFLPGGGELPLAQRTEIGPAQEPVVRSYQLDRGRLETDLRAMNEADGVTLWEGAVVRDVVMGVDGGAHKILVARAGTEDTVSASWVVDATGRAGLLRRRLGLKRGNRHEASAGWFRIRGRLDINDMVPGDEEAWHGVSLGDQRWRSTNHLMGDGYWAWIIPLSSGNTSIGVVVHADTYGSEEVRSLGSVQAFLAAHEPVLASHLEGREVMDFLSIKGYSHNVARSWSADRWALVGEAGAFVDPLYSPGTDFIAFANAFTATLIASERRGEDITEHARALNLQYRALVSGSVGVFRPASPVYGHARAMTHKIYWDNFAYWSFPCQYFLQGIYQQTGAAHAAFSTLGERFVALSDYVQRLLRTWAELAPADPEPGFVGMPSFPSLLVDAHLALEDTMTPEETLAYMQTRAEQGGEMVSELVLRLVQELGPEVGAALLEGAGYEDWDLPARPERLPLEDLVGLERRRALSLVARDVERSLGPVRRHAEADRARALVLRVASG